MRLPSFSSTGRTRARAASVPPTMMVSVPSIAFGTAPDTGASISSTPRAASAVPSARVAAGSDELMSTTTAPLLRAGSALSTASRTALPSGSMVIMSSAPAAASCTEEELPVPFRSNERTAKPSFARLAAMGCPMRPSPMKATVLTPCGL